MGIIGNKTLLHKLPLTQVGGLFATDIATIPNWHCMENANKLSGVPNGYYAGGAWILPQVSGSIANVNGIIGLQLFSVSNLAGGVNIQSQFVGIGDITNAQLSALAFLISSLNSSSTLNASIAGSVNVSANLAGNGNLNGALGALVGIVATLNGSGQLSSNISGAVQAIASLSGNGDLESAIKATVDLVSSITGNNTLSASIVGNWDMVVSVLGTNNLESNVGAKAFVQANIIGLNNLIVNNGAVKGDMSSTISSFSELSPESLASAVWSALASQFNANGTMGEKLNGAGSAGNPWTEIIEGTYTAAQVMRLLASVAAGQTSIIDNGNETATVIFKGLDETTDRVTVEMDKSERINIDLNL
jgi:hypothetical protein